MKRYYPIVLLLSLSLSQKIIIPMDQEQNNHLKAYGIAFFGLTKNMNIEWLLNYRGGSFLFDADEIIASECRLRGVSFQFLSVTQECKKFYFDRGIAWTFVLFTLPYTAATHS